MSHRDCLHRPCSSEPPINRYVPAGTPKARHTDALVLQASPVAELTTAWRHKTALPRQLTRFSFAPTCRRHPGRSGLLEFLFPILARPPLRLIEPSRNTRWQTRPFLGAATQ